PRARQCAPVRRSPPPLRGPGSRSSPAHRRARERHRGAQHAQARVVHAERMSALGLLVAGVSHEINNALNFIYGNLPTLAKYTQVLDELGKTYAARLPDGGAAVLGDLAARAHAARDAVPRIADVIGDGAKQARGIVEDLRRFARKGDDKDM